MAASLKPLPSVERISKSIVRILGQNPGPFTLQGTNTYVIGSKAPYILLDTAEGKPGYVELLKQAISPLDFSDIVLSHWHPDHVDGLSSVLDLLPTKPRIWKFPSSVRSLGDALKDGQVLPCTDGQSLQVVHTPGHTDDSISLLLAGQGLFTADTILGQGTTVFEDLSAYMSSLRRIEEVLQGEQKAGRSLTLFPGHGPVREDGVALVQEYIKHRQLRQDSIVQVLKEAKEPLDVAEATRRVYANDNVPPDVLKAAARGVEQYLDKLKVEDQVVAQNGKWSLRR